jgi:concanavalin A-like lectin/glucanase superfamily protein/putative amidase-like protein
MRARWWAVVFAFLLLAVTVPPVFAGSESPLNGEEEANAPALGEKEASEALQEAELEEMDREEAWEEELASPQAAEERVSSRTAYIDLAPAAAQDLLLTAFPDTLRELNADPARILSNLNIEKTLGSHAARVATENGGSALLESPVPIETEASSTKEAVDLSLEESGIGFEPQAPLTELRLPEQLGGAIQVGDDLAVTHLPGDQDAAAARMGDKDLFFAETDDDTDTLLAPIAGGVEIFEQLRSPESPEHFRFGLSLPEGAELRSDGRGGAEVIDAVGEIVGAVPTPFAVDAQGSDVPVTLTVEGSTLVLDVPHRSLDIAYPALLDPAIMEDWQGWYVGWNGQGLSYWGWQETADYENSTGGSNGCYSNCWGWGLYSLSKGSSYWYPANTYGQWVYTAPNSTAFIRRAVFQAINGDVHNCPTNFPRGSTGIYDVNTNSYEVPRGLYSPPSVSMGNFDTGWVGGKGTRYAVVGIGTGASSGSALKCVHNFFVGGAMIWEDDEDQPQLHTTPTAQWMDKSPVQLNVWAYDPGLGVRSFTATATTSGGSSQTWTTGPRCTGLAASRCGEVWDLSQGPQALVWDPSVMPEGIDDLKITAYDAGGQLSTTTNTITVRIDHAAPTLTVSGTVTEQAKLGTELPGYTIKAVAEDGVPNSPANSDARSGVKNLKFYEDGVEIEPGIAQPGCAGTQSCKASREYEIPTLSRTEGAHKILVTSEDALGHLAKKELTFDITHDAKAPSISASGLPAEGEAVGAQVVDVKVTATDAGRGVTALAMLVDGDVVEEETQTCPKGGCSLEATFGADLTDLEPGPHTLAIKATDAKGNQGVETRNVSVDPTPPTLELAGDLVDHDGEPLGAQTGKLDIEALSGGSPTPVAAYNFNEGSGKTAYDAIGDHDGEVAGTWTTSGKYGGAIDFNGTSDRVKIPDHNELDFTSAFTLEAWVRPEKYREWAALFSKAGPTEPDYSFMVYSGNNSGPPKAYVRNSKGEEAEAEGTGALALNAWSYVAVTSDGKDLRLYVNGNLVDTVPAVIAVTNSYPIRIGGHSDWWEFFDGKIDEVRLYDQALSKAQITEDMETAVEVGEGGGEPPLGEVNAEVVSIAVELDEEEVAGFPVSCPAGCNRLDASYTFDAKTAGPGPHTLYVEAVDEFGNATSETLHVDIPPSEAGTPTCSSETTSEPAANVMSAAEAAASIEETLPQALAPTEAGLEEMEEEEISPTYSAPSPNLESEDSMAESETAINPQGGVSIAGVACLTPGETTNAATNAKVINADSAVFANTGTEASTAIRPTATGVTMVRSINGPEAANSYSWNVTVNDGQEVVELPSGAIAIIEPVEEGETETAPVPDEPETLEDPQSLADAEAQRINSEYEIAKATSETEATIVAVIAEPWILLANETIIPAPIAVAPVIEEPNEFIVTVYMPPGAEEAAVYPVQVTASISTVPGTAHCLPGSSPCGQPDLQGGSQYAVFWGKESHVVEGVPARNPFYKNFGSDNCTNFISQILRAGGAKFMRYLHYGTTYDGTWWYLRALPWAQGQGAAFEEANYPPTWVQADVLPRHLWQYGLVHIDPVQEPWGWTRGTILAEDWFGTNGKGDFNHVQYVVGTQAGPEGREPLIANSSSFSYPNMPWREVRRRIQNEHKDGWQRAAMVWKHTIANPGEKKHTPANLYNSNGLFGG